MFDEYARYVWRTLGRLRVAPSDLDDARQEVFVIFYRRLPQFEGRSSMRTWVYGICTRVALAYHRKRTPQLAELTCGLLDDDRDIPSVPATACENIDRSRALAELDRALALLDEDKRAVFALYELEGLNMAEVAAAVGCPLQTAYWRLHAARRQLASHFSRHIGEPVSLSFVS